MTAVLPYKQPTDGRQRGCPKTPPSKSSNVVTEPFFKGLKILITTPMYLMTVFTCGSGVALFNVIMVSAPTILCPLGFSKVYSEMIAITCIVLSGVVFGYFLGLLIQWKDRKDLSKGIQPTNIVQVARFVTIGLALASIFVAYCMQSKVEYVSTTIALILFGMCGLSLLPICFELCVETTFPVGQASSSGISWISGQFLATLFTILFHLLEDKLDPDWYEENGITNDCGVSDTDATYTKSLFTLSGLQAFLIDVF